MLGRWSIAFLAWMFWGLTLPAGLVAQPVKMVYGGGFAAEEQIWLMQARPDLTPNQGKVYTIDFKRFRANLDRLNAFQAGQVDFGEAPSGTLIFARAQGLKLKAVASIVQESKKGFSTAYLVRDDGTINSLKDMKGKTIGIIDYKSATDLWARQGLITAGLNPDRDAKIVVLPFPAMGNALRTKKIDVGTFAQPFRDIELKQGGVKILFSTKDVIPYEEELLLVFFAESFLQKHPNVVKAFLSDFVKATKYYTEHPRESRQALLDAKLVLTSPEIYLPMQDYYRRPNGRIDIGAMEKQQDLIVTQGWLDKKDKIKISDLVDLSYLPKE